jgi:hypothetical protein
MASSQEYAPLSTDVKPYEDDPLQKFDCEGYSNESQRWKNWQRWPLVLAFISGLLGGIIGTWAVPTIISTVSTTTDKAYMRVPLTPPEISAHQLDDVKTPDGLDLNKLEFLKVPLSYDPVCGKDRHEAKAAGCHYDLLATRWYNDDCYYPDVMEEFFNEIGFETFFLDPKFAEPVSNEMAMSGDWDLLWPAHQDYHIMHCLYQWRRFHRAVLEHRPIDDDVFGYGHTLHCTRMIMEWPNSIKYGKNTTTIIDSRVSYCMPGTAVSQGITAEEEY